LNSDCWKRAKKLLMGTPIQKREIHVGCANYREERRGGGVKEELTKEEIIPKRGFHRKAGVVWVFGKRGLRKRSPKEGKVNTGVGSRKTMSTFGGTGFPTRGGREVKRRPLRRGGVSLGNTRGADTMVWEGGKFLGRRKGDIGGVDKERFIRRR